MNCKDVMKDLKSLGNPQTVTIYRNHGAEGDMFGVKIADLKKVIRNVKSSLKSKHKLSRDELADRIQKLAIELWDTNNSDAMYMAGLIADGSKMTKTQLNQWAKSAWWYMLSEYSVAWVASDHDDVYAIARKWMKSRKENIATSGWATYSAALSVRPDEELDLGEILELLKQIEKDIDSAPNRVRGAMNGFVIAVGTYVKPLLKQAKATAKRIGKVEVDMGDTSCKTPLATEYIAKVESMGRVGKKRSTTRC